MIPQIIWQQSLGGKSDNFTDIQPSFALSPYPADLVLPGICYGMLGNKMIHLGLVRRSS
jgi:hypothetical protein